MNNQLSTILEYCEYIAHTDSATISPLPEEIQKILYIKEVQELLYSKINRDVATQNLISLYTMYSIRSGGSYNQKLTLIKKSIGNVLRKIENAESFDSNQFNDEEQTGALVSLISFEIRENYRVLLKSSKFFKELLIKYSKNEIDDNTVITFYGSANSSELAKDVKLIFLRLIDDPEKFYDLATNGSQEHDSYVKTLLENTRLNKLDRKNYALLDNLWKEYYKRYLPWLYIKECLGKKWLSRKASEDDRAYGIPDDYIDSLSLRLGINLDFISDIIEVKDERSGKFILNPFIRINGKIYTNQPLIEKSLFSYTLGYIQGKYGGAENLWNVAFGDPFEKLALKTICEKFENAGEVKDNGIWINIRGSDIDRIFTPAKVGKNPGQIDCLISTESSYYVVEFKSFYTLGNSRNTLTKILNTDHPDADFSEKMQRKINAVQEYDSSKSVFGILIFEGFELNQPLYTEEYSVYSWDYFKSNITRIITS